MNWKNICSKCLRDITNQPEHTCNDRVCQECNQAKAIDEFAIHGPGYRRKVCNDCLPVVNERKAEVKREQRSREREERQREQQHMPRSREDREKQNTMLREYGFHWRRGGYENNFQLYDRNNSVVSLHEAISSIENGLTKIPPSHQTDRNERNRLFRKNGYYWSNPYRDKDWVLINRHGKVVQMNEYELYDFIFANPERYQHEREKSCIEALQLAHDLVENDALILDCETTGAGGKREEMVEVSILRLDGTVLFHSLVQCNGRIATEATEKSGITNDMLANAPSFPEVWVSIAQLISGKQVAMYNAIFDMRILDEEAEYYHLAVPMYEPVCLMRMYMAIVTEGRYRLQDACEHFGIEASNHRAGTDAEVTRQLLLKMSEVM